MSRESTPQWARHVYSGCDGFFRLSRKWYGTWFWIHIKPEHADEPHLWLLVEIKGAVACPKEVWLQGGDCVRGVLILANSGQITNSVQRPTQSRASTVQYAYKLKSLSYILVNCFTQVFGTPLKLGHLKSNDILNSKVPKWKQHLIQKRTNCFAKCVLGLTWRKDQGFAIYLFVWLAPSGGLRNSSPGSS